MKCENCGSNHNGTYGSGRFCCQKCARGFSTKAKRKEINIKVSKTLTKDKENWTQKEYHCAYCGKPLRSTARRFCSNICGSTYKYLIYINKWKLGIVDGVRSHGEISNHIRRYLFIKYKNKCCKCGWNEVNPMTDKSPLQIHHKDGNYKNNKEDNLEVLCPNCHSITHNFGSLNTGNGRAHRRKQW